MHELIVRLDRNPPEAVCNLLDLRRGYEASLSPEPGPLTSE